MEFTIENLRYDNHQHVHYGNARTLLGYFDNKIPYEKVTNEMIDFYLHRKLFIDTKNGYHKGYLETFEYHAQRIASIIELIRNGIELHPIAIFYNSRTKKVEIDDGWHRMRASYYLDTDIPFHLFVD